MGSLQALLSRPTTLAPRWAASTPTFPHSTLFCIAPLRNAFSTVSLRALYNHRMSLPLRVLDRPLRIHQIRTYASRRPEKQTIINSFPQFEPRPLKPLYRNKVFWVGIGFISLLFLTPIPGWILLGGFAYGTYRFIRYLNRLQSMIAGGVPGRLSTTGTDWLDHLFAQDPHTREVAAATQELAIARVQMALRTNENGIRRVFPVEEGELHFTLPRDVTMANFNVGNLVNMKVVVTIKFMVYLGSGVGGTNKGAEVTASSNVEEDGVRLTDVEVLGLRGEGRIKLSGDTVDMEDGVGIEGEGKADESGVGRGEGEGKTIDATSWTSK